MVSGRTASAKAAISGSSSSRAPSLRAIAVQQPEHLGVLLLREQVDLEIELRAPVREPHLVVLRDQDERGQEDRLQRHAQREEGERVGVEPRQEGQGVPRHPDGEQHRVHPHEAHVAAEPGDRLGHLVGEGAIALGPAVQRADALDVAADDLPCGDARGRLVLAHARTPCAKDCSRSLAAAAEVRLTGRARSYPRRRRIPTTTRARRAASSDTAVVGGPP